MEDPDLVLNDEEIVEDLERLVIDPSVDEFRAGPDKEVCEDDLMKAQIVASNIQHNASNAVILKLPREVLAYILKWVVSDSIDVVSLGCWSLVCKDFYLLSQDSGFWHAICQKIWGLKVCVEPYSSWRLVFLCKPHVHIHGVYISRTSYIRTGDASGSLFYRPYYCVEYYRILRFFPNGELLMLTTPQDPREVVHKLKYKNRRLQGLLVGKYWLHNERKSKKSMMANITATLESYYIPKDITRLQSGRGRRNVPKTTDEYRLELELTSTSTNRKFNKLVWVHHSCCTKYGDIGRDNTNIFDISRQYPALYFNRVTSFTAESHSPL